MRANLQQVDVNSWSECRETLFRFSQLDRTSRKRWWFRGQADFSHDLVPTIDRGRSFPDDLQRDQYIKDLMREFRREAISLGAGNELPTGNAFELLARHHGLPSPYLDWSRSPIVAACFAFLIHASSMHVALFALDTSRIDPAVLNPQATQLELVDEPEYLLVNRRAIQQRGVFMRRSTAQRTMEDLLGPGLFKFRIDATQRDVALADLEQAMVNATNLYYDLEGAARTAWRCR